jgi:hypothetical protein
MKQAVLGEALKNPRRQWHGQVNKDKKTRKFAATGKDFTRWSLRNTVANAEGKRDHLHQVGVKTLEGRDGGFADG